MIKFFILWTIFSFTFLIVYSSSDEVYQNSDGCNLFIYAICFPAVLIAASLIYAGEIIEKIIIEIGGKNND